MTRFFILAILAIFSAGTGLAQMEVKSERTFAGTALYGFMNGGADLYYEYGFKELVSREIVYKDEEFTVDIFTMDTSLDAFGIYSILVHKCLRADSLGRFDCLSKYQLQAVNGNNYVSIVFQSGSNTARKATDEIYRMFFPYGITAIRIPGQLTYLASSGSGTVKYMKGKLGVDNAEPVLTELLSGIENYEIWCVKGVDNKDDVVLFLLQTGKDCTLLQKRIPKENIIRKGEKFVMIKAQ